MSQGFVTTRDNTRIAWARDGKGPPYLWVRAWISHLDIMWQDRKFRSFFSRLGQRFEVVRYDTRGNGLSQREFQAPDLHTLVAELEDVIDGLELDDFVLHGTSFGGPITIAYAAKQPARLKQLILDGTYPNGNALTTPERRDMLVRALKDFPEMAYLYLAHATSPGQYRAAYRRPEVLREMIEPDAASALYDLAFSFDVREQLASITCPTLVLHRRKSHSIPFRIGRRMAEQIPGATFRELSGSEQNLWEGDADEALSIIEEFLGIDRGSRAKAPPIQAFVSYARADSDVVREDVNHLTSYGVGTWIDDADIRAGSIWREAISEAIEHCDAFLAFVSPAYLDSETCMHELRFALDEDRPILIIYLEPTDTPGWFRMSLSDRQSVYRHHNSLSEYWRVIAEGVRALAQ